MLTNRNLPFTVLKLYALPGVGSNDVEKVSRREELGVYCVLLYRVCAADCWSFQQVISWLEDRCSTPPGHLLPLHSYVHIALLCRR